MRTPSTWLPLLLPLLGACQAFDSGTVPLESSVQPGLNERFLTADLDVERFVKMFEGESREVAALREEITASLGLLPGMSVADVGAGTGLFLDSFARGVGSHGTVYAVELSPVFLEHLEERVRRERLAQVRTVACTERSVELPPGAADLIFVCDTYHHFEYPATVLASMHRALRPGGQLVIIDFDRIPALSAAWVLGHVRTSKEGVLAEVQAAGFTYEEEVEFDGMSENYMLRFRRQ